MEIKIIARASPWLAHASRVSDQIPCDICFCLLLTTCRLEATVCSATCAFRIIMQVADCPPAQNRMLSVLFSFVSSLSAARGPLQLVLQRACRRVEARQPVDLLREVLPDPGWIGELTAVIYHTNVLLIIRWDPVDCRVRSREYLQMQSRNGSE